MPIEPEAGGRPWSERHPWLRRVLVAVAIALLAAGTGAWRHLSQVGAWRESQSRWRSIGLGGGIGEAIEAAPIPDPVAQDRCWRLMRSVLEDQRWAKLQTAWFSAEASAFRHGEAAPPEAL